MNTDNPKFVGQSGEWSQENLFEKFDAYKFSYFNN